MLRVFRVTAFVALATALCFPAVADAVDLVKQFQSEHVAAWTRIEEAYSRIELAEEFQTPERIRDGKKPITISYFGDGARHRMDMETPELGLRVSVATSSQSFRLEKPVNQAVFVVKDLNRHAFQSIREGMKERGCLPFAPYSIMDSRLVDFWAQPQFAAVDYQVVAIDGVELLKVDWRSPYTDEEGHVKTRVGSFFFLPRSWALREYAFAYDDKPHCGFARARLEYEGEAHGIPLVKSMKKWTEHPDRSFDVEIMTSRLIRLTTVLPSVERFTLEAFNLPNDLGEAAKPRTGRLWLILLGIVGLVVSWLLAAWVRRRGASVS